ncbi:MAG: exosortase F-associated protein [Flavobacterium sp.]|jgi:exosortase F-associated protein
MIKSKLKIVLIFIGLILLICVRAFESDLFYDPFISFYKSEYFHKPLPNLDISRLLINIVLRFAVNAVLSLLILFLLFTDVNILKVSVYLYLGIGVVLLVVFYCYLTCYNSPDYLVLFYIRRFLIQPVLLVLFVPAFYYQKKLTNK